MREGAMPVHEGGGRRAAGWRRRVTAWVSILFATLSVVPAAHADSASSAQTAGAASPTPNEIRFAEGEGTSTSMPGNVARNTATDTILGHVVESLVALRADMTIGPMLADSWDVSPDGKIYTFHLRHGVLFHNGAPMTSKEVAWSFAYLMKPSSGFSCRNVYDGSKGLKVLAVRTPDPYTVTFELDRPFELFLTHMVDPRCPLAVLHPSSVDSQGAWIGPVATGPYVFSEWVKGQYSLLKPFAGYRPRPEPSSGAAGAKVAHENVRFVTIPDEAAQKSALVAGQIDGMSIDENDLLPPDPRWHVVEGPSTDPALILMQTRDPLLADVRMRRAIALALDMRGIVNAVTNGTSRYNPSLVPDANKLFSTIDATGYTKNLAEVKRLLAEAGYHGQTLKLETNRRFAHMYTLSVYAQALLTKAGIHTELQVLEWGAQVSDFRSGHFQLMSFGYSARIDPALMFADMLGDKSKTPMAQWENPAARKLLHGLEGEADENVRRHTFEQLHQMMIADAPFLMAYYTPDVVVVSSRLHGYTSWPMRRIRLFNVSKD
jgi:peptide/nickel transport system substrate-binding protein